MVRGKDYALVIECERETGRERWSDREVGRKCVMYRSLRRLRYSMKGQKRL